MDFQKTQYCPDCVQFYQNKQFLCSFYELQKDNKYKGGLNLYSINEDNKINEINKFESTGIFDFQIYDQNKIITANVDKSISFLQINDNNIQKIKDIETQQKPIYIDFNDNQFYIAQENGYISILKDEQLTEQKIHQDNVWCIKYHQDNNVLLSGSDDGYMKLFDINTNTVVSKLKCFKEFPIGVTYIQIDKRNTNNLIIGTFNNELLIYDIRNLKQKLNTHKFEHEGGTWRMKQVNDIFSFGMSFGQFYEIGSFTKNYEYKQIYKDTTTHKSLVYGIDIQQHDNKLDILSVSFYDKILNYKTIETINQLKNQLPQTIFQQDYQIDTHVVYDISQSKDQIVIQDPITNNIQIINKFGQIIKQAPFQSKIISMKFSPCSYYISILTEQQLLIVNPQKKELKIKQIDLEGLKPCIQKWSFKSNLAIGTKTGEIIFFYPANSKKIITVGKHSNQITNLDWNKNKLLLSSSKKEKLTISKEDSQTDNSTQFQGINLQIDVSIIKWINIEQIKSQSKQSNLLNRLKSNNIFIAVTSDRKSLIIFDIEDNSKPIRTEFSLNYGKILNFQYLKSGEIIVGFSKGYLIKLSLLNDTLSNEVDNEKIFINHFSQMIVQENNEKIYTIGDQELKIFNIKKFKELREFQKKFNNQNIYIQISQNGQIGISTDNKGQFELLMFYYDTQPKLNEQFLIRQESCNELMIFNYDQSTLQLRQIDQIKEDEFEIQGYELNNNLILIFYENNYKLYKIGQQVECMKQGQMKDDIEIVLQNKNYFILLNKNQMIQINDNMLQEIDIQQAINFQKELIQIDDNFIYIVNNDQFIIYQLSDFKELQSIKLNKNITKLYYNSYDFYFILQTLDNELVYFQPIDQQLITLENFNVEIKEVFFEQKNSNNFCLIDQQNKVYSFIVNQTNYIQDIKIQIVLESISYDEYLNRSGQICQTFLQKEFKPMLFKNGYLLCIQKNKNIHKQYLMSHSYLMDLQNLDENQQSKNELGTNNSLDILSDTIEQQFYQSLELKQFQVSYILSFKLNNREQALEYLAKECLQNFDFQTAIKCYQKLKQYKMVNLISIIYNKDSLLEQKGYIAALLKENDIAKQYFINSQNPKIAIQLLQQNQNFNEALEISQTNNLNDKTAEIYLQLAQQQFTQENFIKAISYYESALKSTQDNSIQQKAYLGQIKICLEQKNTLKIQKLLEKITQKNYFEEIAEICFKNELYEIGVQIYKQIGNIEKITEGLLYLSKEDQQLQKELIQFLQNNLEQIIDLNLLLKLGKFLDLIDEKILSEKVYIQSGDNIALIKFYLFILQDHNKAEEIFQNYCQKSQTAASHLADYFIQINKDKRKAIQYYILAGKRIEAFNRARNEQLIDIYCQYINKVDQKEALVIAQYYENKKEYNKSGKYYEECHQLEKSLVNYIKGKQYQSAIDLVMKLKSEELFEFLVQIFAGNASICEDDDIDNIEIVEPMYLFKLYIAFNRFENANEVALVIIEKEAEDGNYKIAREKSFEMQNLIKKKDNEKLSFELKNKFLIYHSYYLAKTFIKQEKNLKAAYLLNRICSYINYFPKHKVQILTSAVIQCTKAKLKNFAHFWAVTLCKPTYRSQIQPKLKEKIEKIALKGAPQKEQKNQIQTHCIYCNASLNSPYDLSCLNCKNELPICISSGTSISKNQHQGQIMQCKNCNGLTYQYELQDMLSSQDKCPQCNKNFTQELFQNFDIQNFGKQSNQFNYNNHKYEQQYKLKK